MFDPNYVIPTGMDISIDGVRQKVFATGDGCYRLEGQTRSTGVLHYKELVSLLKRPDAWSTGANLSSSSALARLRVGGKFYVEQLSDALQDQVDFRRALCVAIDQLAAEGVKITRGSLSKPINRKRIRDLASKIYSTRPIDVGLRGGSTRTVAIMPKAKTLMKYRDRFEKSGYDEMVLADQTWLRGNRSRRICSKNHELILAAIDDTFLDLKQPGAAQALKRYKTLLEGENASRSLQGLEPIAPVSYGTIANYLKTIGPTALSLARNGKKHVANNDTPGQTDTRALTPGELVEIDECKISLISVSKKNLWYSKLSEEEKQALEDLDELIHARLWLIVVLDVASRMPLGWVLTETPGAEATCAAIRMATRDKTREKNIYGCERDPMPAIGIGTLKGDNGSGIRNSVVKSAAIGSAIQTIDARTYRGGDKPYIERMFGTMESCLFNLLHGYTGRRANALPGYDAIKSGVLDTEELYGLITRYLIDEYPLERHSGTGMFGRPPIVVAKELAEKYGTILPPNAHDRRIHLGWQNTCRITKMGVKFLGLPFNSAALQQLGEHHRSKVTICVDPDDISHATILAEGHSEPILADLSWTAVKDLTLQEFLTYAKMARAEDPELAVDFERTLARVRRERFDHMREITVDRKLPRSYLTAAEATQMAEQILAGVPSAQAEPLPGTVAPGSLDDENLLEGSWDIGTGFDPSIDGTHEQDGVQPDFERPNVTGKLT